MPPVVNLKGRACVPLGPGTAPCERDAPISGSLTPLARQTHRLRHLAFDAGPSCDPDRPGHGPNSLAGNVDDLLERTARVARVLTSG